MINVFLSIYFDVFRQSSRFNFCPLKQSSFNICGVFVDSTRGWEPSSLSIFFSFYRHYRGNPDKRIPEGLF